MEKGGGGRGGEGRGALTERGEHGARVADEGPERGAERKEGKGAAREEGVVRGEKKRGRVRGSARRRVGAFKPGDRERGLSRRCSGKQTKGCQ